jgi:hypothetical protein
MLRLISLFGPSSVTVTASGPPGKIVTLQAAGLPSWVTFSSTPGNPAQATLTPTINLTNVLDALFALFSPTAIDARILAMYPGASEAGVCAIVARLSVI